MTGLPVSPLDVAVSVFGPAVGARVHDVTVAMPLLPVVTAVVGTTVPPPEATAKVTATPLTGLPLASCTITDGSTGTAVPAVADWLFPALRAICVAAPVVPVAVNVTGLPVSPFFNDAGASEISALPRHHALPISMPLLPVVTAVVGATVPPPEVTANVTATPLTGLPLASCTITDGSTATAVPAVADWLFPALRAICVAAPVVPVAVNVTGLPVRPVDVAVRVFGPAVGPRVHDVTVAMPLVPVVAAVSGRIDSTP